MLPTEAHAFSFRLHQALKRSLGRVLSATELATQFNLRHHNEPITPQSAQKWLTGKTMPTADKCETLAGWLNVPLHWLRFGPPEPVKKKSVGKVRQGTTQPKSLTDLSADEKKLVTHFRTLTGRRHQLVLDLVEDYAHEQEMFGQRSEE
jgi:transcriptional regulator with XRE-family HTH domain